MTIINSDTTS